MNWNIPSIDKVKALLIVAHPDDETIFCGGAMLYYPNWEWTVVCVTNPEEKRYLEFQKAMKCYENFGVKIKSSMTLEQEDREYSGEEEIRVLRVWSDVIKSKGFSPELVFTHNNKSEGDYVHQHHKWLNEVVHRLFPNVWEFICPISSGILEPSKSKINKVPLNADILEKKNYIFNNCYSSQKTTWSVIPNEMEHEFKKGPEIFTSD